MIKLIRNADVYAPAHLGKKDVLVIADKVVRIADKIEGYEGMPEVEVFDFSGKKSRTQHIGLCLENNGKTVKSLDGNTSSESEDNGGTVNIRERRLKYVTLVEARKINHLHVYFRACA